jgi:hypothetical protein
MKVCTNESFYLHSADGEVETPWSSSSSGGFWHALHSLVPSRVPQISISPSELQNNETSTIKKNELLA